jgi:hypothetical protein
MKGSIQILEDYKRRAGDSGNTITNDIDELYSFLDELTDIYCFFFKRKLNRIADILRKMAQLML